MKSLLALLSAATLALCGCGKDYYQVYATRPAAPAAPELPGTLVIRTLGISAAYDTDIFQVRKAKTGEVEPRGGYRWVATPDVMLTDYLTSRLLYSRIFGDRVLGENAPHLRQNYTMGGTVDQVMIVDDGDNMTFTVQLSVVLCRGDLITSDSASVLMLKTYTGSAPVPDRCLKNVATAANHVLDSLGDLMVSNVREAAR